MPPLPSNIRVSVHYAQPTVFAGEEIEATITFHNISQPVPAASNRFIEPDWDAPSRAVNSYAGGERSSKPPVAVVRALPGHVQTSGEQRPALARHGSLNEKRPPSLRHKRSQSLMLNTANSGRAVSGPDARSPGAARPAHGRTLSIMSLATDVTASGKGSAVPKRGHNRAVSVQVPRRTPSGLGVAGASPRLGVGQPSPLIKSSSPGSPANPQNEYPFPLTRKSSRSPRQASQTWPSPRGGSRRASPNTPPQAFVFPPPKPARTDTQSTLSPSDPIPEPDSAVSPMTQRPILRTQSPRPPEGPPENVRQVTKLLSDAGMSETPRSSVDVYSHANNSDETLDSEYVQPSTQRWFTRPELFRGSSSQRILSPRLGPETLMMGYVQVSGSFAVDGSLINQSPFEEVKRKGVVGGQGGGGVVGVDQRSKRNSGLLGALGWGNITDSLNGILGSGEPSSLREMKATASSKAIPLLSTPQSVLFVDLKIAPGESKSYTYTFRLPRGLPPSFRGRAIKISYHLTIGTQRPGAAKEQQHVSSVEVPFRVLGSVNTRGDILGHDLMSPHVILRDQARTSLFDPTSSKGLTKQVPLVNGQAKPSLEGGIPDFQNYVNKLLSKPEVDERDGPPSALLSPTDVPPHRRRSSILDEVPTTQKEAIDLAILRSSQSIPTRSTHARSTTRFDIARSGCRVCTISLLRPAYRLGESIHLSIDLSAPEIPTYALCVTLETQEQVDPGLALRSAASVGRVTRRVHASQAENCMFAQRVGVSLAIPWNATPEFVTSGLGMRWRIRVEFIGPRIELRRRSAATPGGPVTAADDEAQHLEAEDREGEDVETNDGEDEDSGTNGTVAKGAALDLKLDFPKLLEERARDHRARILGAVEMLQCDSFEVEVPVRVYGALVEADDGGDVEGLVI